MGITSQITVSVKPELYQSGLKGSSFKPGSTLMLKVLELRGDRALIDFGNFRATADIKIPVTLGQELLVKVQQSGKQLKLSLINPGSGPDSATDSGTRRLENVSTEALAVIQKDIKQILNQNEALMPKSIDSRTITAMRQAVDALLTDITNQQGRAVRQLDSPEPFQVFTYALPLEADKQAAKLKIYYQKKQNSGSKKGFQISLLLSMDRLGAVRTDFYLLEKDLTVTFFVKDQATKIKIQENCPELQEFLNPIFNQTLVRTVVSEKKINDFDHEDEQITSDGRIDVRI